jgi:hypothetical protein
MPRVVYDQTPREEERDDTEEYISYLAYLKEKAKEDG